MTKARIGIIGAMPEEVAGIVDLLTDREEMTSGMRTYFTGKIGASDVVVVFSRWGKVAASATVTNLITQFKVTSVIFTGVAGGLAPTLAIGDIVIGQTFIQHDLDPRPMMQRFEIPLLGMTSLSCTPEQVVKTHSIVQSLIDSGKLSSSLTIAQRNRFNIVKPAVHVGTIVSGDRFISSHADRESIISAIPEVLCVEMEGAAVAQVCYEFEVPYTIIRTISDTADPGAHHDFTLFTQAVASVYSAVIVKALLTA